MIDPCAATAAELQALWRKNRAQLCEDHAAGRVILAGRPVHLKIELTNFCNLKCKICPHGQMRRPVGYMDPSLFRKIIDEGAPALEFAYLHHLGESTFHGRIGELVRYARQRGVRVGLSTNGTVLGRRKAQALIDGGLDFLVISLDADSAEVYARARAGGDFQGTLRNVDQFLDLNARAGGPVTTVVQMVVSADNRHEAAAFAATWRRRGERVMIKEARDWAGQVALGLPRRPPAPGACRMPFSELTVLWDGTVVPCANFYERQGALGNLSRQRLDEVWNGPALQALRAAHLEGELGAVPICASCPRHPLDHAAFVAEDQLSQRLRHYRSDDLTPRPGLS